MSLRYSVRRGNPGDEARVGDADADEGASSSGWKAEIESITNGAAGRAVPSQPTKQVRKSPASEAPRPSCSAAQKRPNAPPRALNSQSGATP